MRGAGGWKETFFIYMIASCVSKTTANLTYTNFNTLNIRLLC